MTLRRWALLYVAPIVILLLWVCAPLITGSETLYLRDVLNTHLGLKWAGAQALMAGELPWVDLWRGGQPLLGNLNAAPLYPLSLLFAWLPVLWLLNAQFWLHWLVAPFSMYWLGRSWGLDRSAAWAGGVIFATCGYLFSNLSFFNLIAGVALTPAFIACALDLTDETPRRSRFVLSGVLWALLLLAGDPLLAAQAFALASAAVWIAGRRGRPWLRWAAALAGGTLVAMPQLVEFLRILPDSYRGRQGFSAASATIASFDPRQMIDWLVPLAFGRPDRFGIGSFWGAEYHTGKMAYYFTLYPGLLALALVISCGRARSRAALWAWLSIGLGVLLSLGRFNPLTHWLYGLEVGRMLRYPVKFWLLVAVAGSLLCAIGFSRLMSGEGRPGFSRAVLSMLLITASAWVALSLMPGLGTSWLATLMPADTIAVAIHSERTRWAGLMLISSILLVLYGFVARALGRRRGSAPAAQLGALLLILHAGSQIFFLHATVASDDVGPYLEPAPTLEAISPDELVVHGSFKKLFGPSTLGLGHYPDGRSIWLERRAFADLYPFAGALHGRRYDLVGSPEGLDTFLSEVGFQVVQGSSDLQRLRLLRAWGVDVLLLHRPLDAAALAAGPTLRRRGESFGQPLYVYDLAPSAPELSFVGDVTWAASVNAAVDRLRGAEFDALEEVVLPGEGPRSRRPRGEIVAAEVSARGLEARVRSSQGGVLVLQRAFLSLYRARVDGQSVPVREANISRLGVEVPRGEHRVEIWFDRRPFFGALGLAALGLAWLAFGTVRCGRRRPTPDLGG